MSNIVNRRLSQSLVIVMMVWTSSSVWGQTRSLLNTELPTGEIGQVQVGRRPELAGVWQPVLVRVPDGANLWFAEGSSFSKGQRDAQLVSLQVGSAYRLRVTDTPNVYGDVYPTIEIIDRMHAPPGKETRYPVPVQITTEELRMALSGKFVTRVIYVEDPRNAVSARELPEQRYFEALPSEDPYEVASRIGRPIAILRMGSVVPKTGSLTSEFLFGSPPLQHHMLWPKQPQYVPSELRPSDLPAEPEKLTPLPAAPTQPETVDALPSVPESLPEKKVVEEDPVPTNADEAGLFDDPAEQPADDGADFSGDLFEDDASLDDAGDMADDDDPFADFE